MHTGAAITSTAGLSATAKYPPGTSQDVPGVILFKKCMFLLGNAKSADAVVFRRKAPPLQH